MRKETFVFHYNHQKIPYDVWYSKGTKQVDIIVFLGTVQIGALVEKVAAHCPPGVAVVEGAKHWLTAEDGHNTVEFMLRYVAAAFATVEATTSAGLSIVAESQAVPCVVAMLKTRLPIPIRSVILLQPLGLNPDSFGTNDHDRLREFQKRISRNFRWQLAPLVTDSALWFNHRQLLKYVDFRSPASRAQYTAGLRTNILHDIQEVQDTYDMTIVCGGRDELFKVSEIKASLNAYDISVPLVVVPGVPHSPLATKLGIILLHKALQLIHKLS